MTYWGMLDIVEDDQFHFDEQKAWRPVRFIEKFCLHRTGKLAGQPFKLAEIQRKIITDVYGWVDRTTGLRRFNKVFWSGAVGCGKSPVLGAIGVYELIEGGEAGAQLFSIASTFQQARIVFDAARGFITDHPALAERCEVLDREIRCGTNKWLLASGKPKAGANPQGIYCDEFHECDNREIYDTYDARMGKRQQPIFWIATNAGDNRQSLCWQVHEEAQGVLNGTSANKRLYPILWEAPNDAPVAQSSTWRMANPLMDITIPEEKVREQYETAQGIPALEARFRRLQCGQWVQGSNKWLDMQQVDRAVSAFSPADTKDHALYLGLDGSEADDLFAVVPVYAGQTFYIDSHFYLPRATAEKYDQKNGTKYLEWASKGHLTLLDAPTISPEYQRSVIAQKIIQLHKAHAIKAVCYDRNRVDDLIDELEKAGITCLPIAQGYTVSPGCRELDRRLKEQSIKIAPNPVLTMCCENVEVKPDDRGNIWPVKQHQKGQYAGTRALKIDGVQALVTALSEAHKHNFGKKVVAKAWIV